MEHFFTQGMCYICIIKIQPYNWINNKRALRDNWCTIFSIHKFIIIVIFSPFVPSFFRIEKNISGLKHTVYNSSSLLFAFIFKFLATTMISGTTRWCVLLFNYLEIWHISLYLKHWSDTLVEHIILSVPTSQVLEVKLCKTFFFSFFKSYSNSVYIF